MTEALISNTVCPGSSYPNLYSNSLYKLVTTSTQYQIKIYKFPNVRVGNPIKIYKFPNVRVCNPRLEVDVLPLLRCAGVFFHHLTDVPPGTHIYIYVLYNDYYLLLLITNVTILEPETGLQV